jgi:hypothetical protein
MTEGSLACFSNKLKHDGTKYKVRVNKYEMEMFQTVGAPANEKAVFFYAVTELWRSCATLRYVG